MTNSIGLIKMEVTITKIGDRINHIAIKDSMKSQP
jgi:hypothetical protein